MTIVTLQDVGSVGAEAAAGEGRVTAHLESQLAKTDLLDSAFGVYIARLDDDALRAARALDAAAARGEQLPALAGMTIAVKDLIAVRGAATTAQSLVHDEPWFDGADAPIVAQLRAAGAMITGKTSMAEHAAGRIDPAKPFPVPRNPWDPKRWPGGSSSGSAIAVALGLADAALGSDTTGSLRIPAAFCGITGFRPSTGLVDGAGCMAASPTLDTMGPMAKSARVCARVLSAIAPIAEPEWRESLAGVRVGVPRTLIAGWADKLDNEIRVAFERSLTELQDLGAILIDIELPEWELLTSATMLITAQELYAGHAETLRTRWTDYGRSFRRIAAIGGFVPEEKISAVRAALCGARDALLARFDDFDVIAIPTWAQPPALYDERLEMSGGELNLTAAWAAAGLPCIATPMGLDSRGLPMSLQLAGKPGDDLRVLEITDCVERSSARPLPAPPEWTGEIAAVPDPDQGSILLTEAEHAALAAMVAPLEISPEPHDLAAIHGMLKALGA